MANTGRKIGFADKFFTLWNVEPLYSPRGDGREIIGERHTYIKNVSMSEDKVRELYPELEIDFSLNGKRSFTTYFKAKDVEYPTNQFQFGKFAGHELSEVDEKGYLEWYAEQVETHDYSTEKEIAHFENVKSRMKDFGFVYVGEHGYRFMTEEVYQEYLQEKADIQAFIDKAMQGEPLNVFMEVNPNGEGEYFPYDTIKVRIVFAEVKESYYQGFSYYLPAIKGKGKRVKNKEIIIRDYSVRKDEDGNVYVDCSNFEICKIAA